MLELNKIYCMDCLEGLGQLEDNSVDLIVTDPPYGINYFSGHYKNGNPHKEIINDDTLFIPLEQLWRVLKSGGCMFIFYSQKKPLIDDRVRNVIVWVKNNWTAGDLKGDFGNQYELIAYIPKVDFKIKSKRYSNVWNFKRVPATELLHPTQKPDQIIMRMIECGTKEGDLILDPFIGSGTTAVACKQTGRNFIGFEISQEYCDIANKRLSQCNLNEWGKYPPQNEPFIEGLQNK